MIQQLKERLLMYLCPDPSPIDDIAVYLYGETSEAIRKRCHTIISRTRRLGWNVRYVRGGFILCEDHYEIVAEHTKLLREWNYKVSLTPWRFQQLIQSLRSFKVRRA